MEKYGELLTEVITQKLTAGAVPQERPVAVFVAGQAGSGKTLVMDLVHAALEQRGGAVRVLPFLHRFVELALAFHHAVRSEDQELAAVIGRLRTLTATGDFAYFIDIAHFMTALPLPEPSTIRWTTNEDSVRSAWRGLVQVRQEHLLGNN
ncbi:zeta toxin family protein [Streptomyces sp. NPDC006654]|uniref:zeta toxin family protein n=1 Tax=Streptomyces sp. NPDC006654 TaxID=3156897 RepID=UPI0033EEE2ED